MSIQRSVQIAAVTLFGTLLIAIIVFTLDVNAIRIGGSRYDELRDSYHLEANSRSPALYLVEPFLEANELLSDPGHEQAHARKLGELHKLFDDEHREWMALPLTAKLKIMIGSTTYVPAQQFWTVIETRLLPAIKQGDRAAAASALADARKLFAEHQAAVLPYLEEIDVYQDELIDAARARMRWIAAVLGTLACLLLVGLGVGSWLMIRRLVQPLAELSEVTSQLAAGQDLPVPHTAGDQELGRMARAVEHFHRSALERAATDARDSAEKRKMIDALADVLMRMADGDLRKSLNFDFSGEYRSIGENLNLAVNTLRTMVQNVVSNATSISGSAAEISAASADLSTRTQSTAAALEETNAALSQVDTRLASSRDAAESTAMSASRARTAVDQGLARARRAAQVMEQVRGSAASVDGVMEALDKIAFQTRVLAMNAAVEAGHAAEAGKGFAVVADLVSQLAVRAEAEAREAREQLTATTARIDEAVTSVAEVEQEFGSIVGDVATVAELIGQLAEDSRAQTIAIGEIGVALRQMDTATQQNAAMVEQTSAAASSLLDDARTLVGHADKFQWERRHEQLPVTVDRRAPAGSGRTNEALQPEAGAFRSAA
ncbi:methyl-accepting chemotaxis protein [Sphingomonas ginkgonis]|uniref:Methyl-accepting chemotaxis protein n=1 Tax=Sphingomonas ginkgonis TaxID=2315330 RepID=A0A429VCX7_9SPHN|nr:methyl-accepting chemotaxis protein [Sphingomonas ginkgonis]RST31794.1 methyl-accepting chemotaxis protein [Sphingomonas ginkgonis]